MFCYVVGNSIKALLAGKLHFLWRVGMGHPSRAGIWASGLAAKFITSHPPAGIRTGGITSEPGWPHRHKTAPWNLLCPTAWHPNDPPSLEHLPWELGEPPRSCCIPAPTHLHRLGLRLHGALGTAGVRKTLSLQKRSQILKGDNTQKPPSCPIPITIF